MREREYAHGGRVTDFEKNKKFVRSLLDYSCAAAGPASPPLPPCPKLTICQVTICQLTICQVADCQLTICQVTFCQMTHCQLTICQLTICQFAFGRFGSRPCTYALRAWQPGLWRIACRVCAPSHALGALGHFGALVMAKNLGRRFVRRPVRYQDTYIPLHQNI